MNRNQQQVNDSESIGFSQVLNKFLPYWPVYAALFVISMLSTFIYLKLAIPEYNTQASILLKDEKKGEENSKMEQDLNLLGSKNIVENQLEILKSNSVLKKVVNKLSLNAEVNVESGWFGLVKKPAHKLSPVRIQIESPESVVPVEQVYFTYDEKEKNIVINNRKYPIDSSMQTEWGKLRFVANPNYIRPQANDKQPKLYFNIWSQGDAIKELAGSLKAVASNKNNTIVKLSVNDHSPERGEQILREIVYEYYLTNAEKKNKIAANTLQFIEQRINGIEKELNSLESSIQQYRTNTGSIDMSEQSQLYLQRIEDNDKQINQLSLQMSALDEVEKYVSSKSEQESIAPSVFSINDPVLTNLLGNLYNAESKYSALKNVVAENNPMLLSVREDISKTRANILENIKNQKTSLQSSRRQLDNTNYKYSSMLGSIPRKEKELVEVSRDRNTKRDIYAYLLQKREEIAYSMNSSFEETFFVDNPTSTPNPVSPNRKLMYLIGAILPLVIGSAFVYSKESLSGKIMYRHEIEQLSKFPVIGEIIFDNPEVKLPAASNSRAFVNEQFRFIRNAYKYAYRNNSKTDKILITSSLQGEGKSFFAANFAVSMAKAGKKVLLIELDLHRPKLNEYFGMKADKGMIDYLSHAAMLKEIIIPYAANPSLSIIFAGNPQEDVSELLTSGKIDYLLKTLEPDYNAIIIDSTPMKAVSDAILIAPKCNLTMFIIRHDVTPKSIVENLDRDMENYNFKNVVVVFNGVKNRGFGKYSYGKGYGYGYDFKKSYETYVNKEKQKEKSV
jgi:capsular exopolysaccharide synthesis family protein